MVITRCKAVYCHYRIHGNGDGDTLSTVPDLRRDRDRDHRTLNNTVQAWPTVLSLGLG